MADPIDQTADRMEVEADLSIRKICQQAAAIPPGRPGDCFYCGEYFPRVIFVTDPRTGESVESCGRCRDKRGIA